MIPAFSDHPLVSVSKEFFRRKLQSCQLERSPRRHINKNFNVYSTFSFSYTTTRRQFCVISRSFPNEQPVKNNKNLFFDWQQLAVCDHIKQVRNKKYLWIFHFEALVHFPEAAVTSEHCPRFVHHSDLIEKWYKVLCCSLQLDSTEEMTSKYLKNSLVSEKLTFTSNSKCSSFPCPRRT